MDGKERALCGPAIGQLEIPRGHIESPAPKSSPEAFTSFRTRPTGPQSVAAIAEELGSVDKVDSQII